MEKNITAQQVYWKLFQLYGRDIAIEIMDELNDDEDGYTLLKEKIIKGELK